MHYVLQLYQVTAAEKVNIGVPSWTGAQAIANLLAAVVEMRIGGEAELVPGNNATIFQAMDQGKGDIDVHPDVWLPNQESFTNKYVEGAGTVQLSSNPYEGNQGFCVSQDFAAKMDITDIADLGRPDVAELMDSDGNGLGEMWIGAPGWASANVNQVKVRDYGLMDFIEPVRAEESVKTARASKTLSPKVRVMLFIAISRTQSGLCLTLKCYQSLPTIQPSTSWFNLLTQQIGLKNPKLLRKML